MKKLIALVLVAVLCFSLSACLSDPAKPSDIQKDNPAESEQPPKEQVNNPENETPGGNITYQSVLDEYTGKLQTATPKLIEEYNNEAKDNTGGLTGLAELSNAKISELAEISLDGIQRMAEIHLHSGSGKQSEYEEWAGKLQAVYMEEAEKITQAYMDSAT